MSANLGIKPDIVAFLPYANIWNSSSANSNLLRTLQANGHPVRIIDCHSIFKYFCASMEEAGLSPASSLEEKSRICGLCRGRADLVAQKSASRNEKLDKYLFLESEQIIESQLVQVDSKNWVDFTIEDLPIGSVTGYEFFVRHKLTSETIPEELFPEFREILRQTLRVFHAWKEFLKESNESIVLVENEMYSANRVVALLSRGVGKAVYSISHGVDLRKFGNSLALINDPSIWFSISKSESWTQSANRNPTDGDISQVSEHVLELSLGRSPWVYSSRAKSTPQNLVRKRLKIPERTPIVLAITSSLDEQIATNLSKIHSEPLHEAIGSMFADQLDWIKFLVDEASKQNSYHLVIRIHPRLLPNKRDSVKSDFSSQIMETIGQIHSNISVNFPSDSISIWSILSESALVANYSSTAGLEALMLGKTVLQHDPRVIHAYPSEFNVCPNSREKYSEYLSEITNNTEYERDSRNIENVFAAYRWLSWKFRVFARNVENGLPDRQKWTAIRVLNGLVLRRGYWILEKPLQFLERLELSKQKIDTVIQGITKDLFENKKSDFSKVSIPEGWPERESRFEIARSHIKVLERIFGKKGATKLQVVRALKSYLEN